MYDIERPLVVFVVVVTAAARDIPLLPVRKFHERSCVNFFISYHTVVVLVCLHTVVCTALCTAGGAARFVVF